MTRACFICGDSSKNRLQRHHIVPRRYGGADHEENLVTLCGGCHQAIEKIYDSKFYQRLQNRREAVTEECWGKKCDNSATTRLRGPRPENPDKIPACDQHNDCAGNSVTQFWGDECGTMATHVLPSWSEYSHRFLCQEHAICGHDECYADDVFLLKTEEDGILIRCYNHAKEYDLPYYWE
jgi:5-methylcytosine-specific restriction endonuclease McrA